jgi:hypothetical protein
MKYTKTTECPYCEEDVTVTIHTTETVLTTERDSLICDVNRLEALLGGVTRRSICYKKALAEIRDQANDITRNQQGPPLDEVVSTALRRNKIKPEELRDLNDNLQEPKV